MRPETVEEGLSYLREAREIEICVEPLRKNNVYQLYNSFFSSRPVGQNKLVFVHIKLLEASLVSASEAYLRCQDLQNNDIKYSRK
jgi:hypothetical protein